MRRPDGVSLVAVWHFIAAIFFLLGLCAMMIPIVAVLSTQQDSAAPIILFLFIDFVIVISFALFLVVGWGLWKLKSWAYAGGIVLAVLQLPALPIGTVVGALTLWYLLSDPDAKAAFAQ